MNEFYAAEPSACGSSIELKLLLERFGPYTGRYLAAYPDNWFDFVEKHYGTFGPVEQERIKLLLHRARNNALILTRRGLPWENSRTWQNNAIRLLGSKLPVLTGIIAANNVEPAPSVWPLSELDLPPTAEERIYGTAEEYVRVCRTLLSISPELHFVDPYLDMTKQKNKKIINALFEALAGGKCMKATFWARATSLSVGRDISKPILDDLRRALDELCRNARVRQGFVAEYIFVRDEDRKSKMHGRYLLSIKGGVRLDQGFESLPSGRRVDVGPVGKALHDELLSIFHEGKHDMEIVSQLKTIF